MKKKLKKVLLISGGVFFLFLLVLLIGSLIFFYKKSLVKGFLEDYLAGKTEATIEIGKLDYGIFPLRIEADSVKVIIKKKEEEIKVVLDRLALKGEVKRFLKKERPIFDSVEVKGAVISANIKQKRKIDYRESLKNLSRILDYADQIKVKDISLSFVSPLQEIKLQEGSLFLSHSEKNEEFDYFLSAGKAALKTANNEFALKTSFLFQGKISLDDMPFLDGEACFDPLDITLAERNISIEKIALELRSELQSANNILFFPKIRIDIPSLLDVSASSKIDFSSRASLFLTSEIHLKDFKKAHDLLGLNLNPELKDLILDGEAFIEGECQYLKNFEGTKTNIKSLVKLKPTKIRYSTPEISFSNSVSGEFHIKGSLSDLKYSGRLKIKDGCFSGDNLEIQDFSLEFPVNGSTSFLDISLFKGVLGHLSYSLDGKKLEFDQLMFNGRGTFDGHRKKIDFELSELKLPSFPSLQMKAKVDLSSDGERYLHLRCSRIDFESLIALCSPFVPKEIEEWEPRGYFNLETEIKNSLPQSDEWSFFTHLDFQDVIFHNSDFTIAAESCHPKIAIRGDYHSSLKNLSFSFELNLSQGESLWNEYYLNWSQNPFQGKVIGLYHIPLKMLSDLSIEASLSPLGGVKSSGFLKFPGFSLIDLRLSTSRLGIDALYSFFSPGEMDGQRTLLLGGEVNAQLRLKKQKHDLSLTGQVRVKNGSVENKTANLSIKGIEAKIPIHFEQGIKKDEKEDEIFRDKGYFLAQEWKTPYFSMIPLKLHFYTGRNKFRLQPLTIEIFGGSATLGRSVFIIDPFLRDFKGVFSFSLDDADISELPIESSRYNLEGKARVYLFRVEINPQILKTEGRGEIDIFDGRITLKNIRITSPFSPDRTFSCDMEFEDLNLEKLTDSVPFGRVTGIIRGEIKDLAFSYGQPESFVMNLESVKRRGIPQKFSIRAVNDLAIISSGEKTSLSRKRGFARFVSDFRYKKIGICCSLRNDLFTLRGTIKEKGLEYLVKRSWIFGISVINRKPENQISFKDMISRLKRIGGSQ